MFSMLSEESGVTEVLLDLESCDSILVDVGCSASGNIGLGITWALNLSEFPAYFVFLHRAMPEIRTWKS